MTARPSFAGLGTALMNFAGSNPIPVKAALALMGLCEERCRLPLVPASDATREALRVTMHQVGLL